MYSPTGFTAEVDEAAVVWHLRHHHVGAASASAYLYKCFTHQITVPPYRFIGVWPCGSCLFAVAVIYKIADETVTFQSEPCRINVAALSSSYIKCRRQIPFV